MTCTHPKESECEKMTYSFQDSENLHSEEEKSLSIDEGAKRAKIHSMFNQCKKEMLHLRNFSEMTLRLYQEVFTSWVKYVE